MAQLIVRNLDEEVVRQLKVRAAQHGRSAEEEHRDILRRVLRPDGEVPFSQLLLSMPDVGTDEDFGRDDDVGRDIGW